eukprot:183247-Ditylum_brightwellii.AAC.1
MWVTLDLMSSKILVAVMGHVELACVTVFTGVVGEADGNTSNLLTVSAQARTGQMVGSPDLCMVVVEGDGDGVGEKELAKNLMSWSVIVLVRRSAVLPENCRWKSLLVFQWWVFLGVPPYLLHQQEPEFACWCLGWVTSTTLLEDCTNMVHGLLCGVPLNSFLMSLGEITAAHCFHKGLKQAQFLVPGEWLQIDVL